MGIKNTRPSVLTIREGAGESREEYRIINERRSRLVGKVKVESSYNYGFVVNSAMTGVKGIIYYGKISENVENQDEAEKLAYQTAYFIAENKLSSMKNGTKIIDLTRRLQN